VPQPHARTVSPMTKTLLAVDGNSLAHRSFHALAASGLRSSDGRPTWAVKGFISQLLSSVERTGADAIVVGFDDHTGSVRRAAHPHYKATRKAKPPELGEQIALIGDVLRAAGVHVVVPAGLEADDVLASAATTAAKAGWRCVIVTSDRDSFALIDETTNVLRIINGGVDNSPVLTPDRLVTLVGVRPDQYCQYAALRGDTSDNLTGVHGIGEKTAARLLTEFGTVEAAFADVDAGGAAVAAAIGKAAVGKLAKAESREAFARNVSIMTMRRDLELGLDLTGGAGCLPLDPATVLAALDSVQLAAAKDFALRVLTGSGGGRSESSDLAVAPGGGAPAALPEQRTAPEPRRQLATAGAMPGSSAARPAIWDDTLF
jgi:5'-3' exonuclease